MKKNLRKTFAKATALAMAVAMMVSLVPADSAAAKKAKKPKLAKSVKVTVKKTKKVKIKNTKKIKKTKWSIKSKKVATISKKKKTSVVVKGKKAGKSTTLTAKVTLKGKKKALKLKCKVKVVKATKKPTPKPATKKPNTPAPKPATQKPTTNKPADKTPAPTPDKIGDVEVDSKATLNIPVTELNETSITCDAKRTEKGQEATHVGAEYTRKGLKFTTKEVYNSGAMFYLDPITSEADLEDAPEGEDASNQGGRIAVLPKAGKGGKVDIADYDYLRITLFDSPYETNLRLYDDLDQFIVDGNGFPGTCTTFYGKDSQGRGDYVGKEKVDPQDNTSGDANHYYKDAAKTQDAGDGYILVPVSEIVKNAKTSEFIGVAVCGQFKNQEYGISKIEFLKVKDSKPANKPASVVVSADKDKILNGATLQMSASVLDKNETAVSGAAVTWSVAGDAATISATGLLTADATKTGKVTVTAASKEDPTVKATYEVEICNGTSLMSIKFDNKYTTYTIDETKGGLDIAAKGLNGAGEPVASQPAITVTASGASDGISYANGKLTATKAGSIKLTATYEEMKDEVTIKVVNGMRVALTADNVKATGSGTITVSNGVSSLESSDWGQGTAVGINTGDKKVANIAGLLWTLQIADAKNCDDNKPNVGVRATDDSANPLTKPSQPMNWDNWAPMWEGAKYTAEDYAKGVDLEAAFDWNFCVNKAGEDATYDTSGNEVYFTLTKHGPGGQVYKISNVIVLWGEEQQMPAVKSVAVSEATDKTEVPANGTLNLIATATYENDKTRTVTKNAECTWTSSDTEVATVSAGKVTPKKEGTTKITATFEGKTSAEYTITVTAAEQIDPVTLTNTTEIDGHGCVKFADCTGYPESGFDVTKYNKVTVTYTISKDGEVVKGTVSGTDGKITTNCSTDSSSYNQGWGEGFDKKWVDGSTADATTGEITVVFNTVQKGALLADCISSQVDGHKILIKSIKLENVAAE